MTIADTTQTSTPAPTPGTTPASTPRTTTGRPLSGTTRSDATATRRPTTTAAGGTEPAITPFDAPAFAPLAAVRDRGQEAKERAAEQRESGYTDGYEVGLAAARQEIEATIEFHRNAAARLDQAMHALEQAAAQLRGRDAVTLAELEREAVALAVALATEIVGRELATTPEPVRDALARAAWLIPDRGTPIVRVHPDDAELARAATTTGAWDAATAVIADPAIEPGGCVVDIGRCRIDAQIGPAVERMRDAL